MKLYSLAPYLLLVSFFTGPFANFDSKKIDAVNVSPYNGVAVPLTDAFDTDKHSSQEFQGAIALIKKESRKDVWPWVFFNRFIGYKEGEPALMDNKSNKPYFRGIAGMDIYNRAGALGDFYEIWQIALRLSRELGSPGIVVDPEAYNKYRANGIDYLKIQYGRSRQEVIVRLHAIGAELLDLAEKEHPQATIWFLQTGLGGWKTPAVTKIIEGMLARARERRSQIKIVCGGSLSLGQCSESLSSLEHKISRRNQEMAPLLAVYPNLHLAGRITPWDDAKKKQGPFLKGECGQSRLQNLEDFKPLINLLARSYKYLWIYAAMMVGYDPYDPKVYPKYNKAIGEALIGSR